MQIYARDSQMAALAAADARIDDRGEEGDRAHDGVAGRAERRRRVVERTALARQLLHARVRDGQLQKVQNALVLRATADVLGDLQISINCSID